MRIAAGVILIIAAVINLVAAFGYFAVGGVGKIAAMGAEEAKKDPSATADTKEAAAKADAAMKQLGTSGGALMGFSVYLLVTVGTSIAGAVCLFRRKAAKFIMIASAMALGAEIGGIVIIKFGVLNILGLVGGILGILAARSIMAGDASPAAMPPAAAPM